MVVVDEMSWREVSVVVDRVRYSTEEGAGATWLAASYSTGRASHLFRGRHGRYFVQYVSCWEGERPMSIEPLTVEEAEALFYQMERMVDFEEAFPGLEAEVEEA